MIRRALLVVATGFVAALALPPLWYAVFPEPAPELPAAGRRVEVAPGVGVNLLDSGGAGRPIVLVHGHPGSAYDWARLTRELADPGAIEIPILVVHGDGDRLVPPSVAEGLHDRSRRGALWVVPGAGHALPVTRAGELAERIVAFAGSR